MSKSLKLLAASSCLALVAGAAVAEPLGLGREATSEEIAAWDVNVMPDGTGLPPGGMSVEDGEMVFVDNCAACHGDFAEGIDNWPPLAGGRGTLTDVRPVKTVGSYWPYLSTVWDYVHRSMPFGNAQILSPDEVYGITAYILYSEGLVDYDFVLTNENFTEVRLPNEDGFYVDDRIETEFPVFSGEPCMSDCKDGVEVTRRAADLKVTPMDALGRPAGTIPNFMADAPAGDMIQREEQVASAEQAEAEPADVEPQAAAPDPELVAAGERAFRQCQSCHQVGEGARSRTGPHLNALFGRAAGSVEDFRYSPAFQAAGDEGLVWTAETLHDFLSNPRDYIKGTRMAFRGFRDEGDIAAVTAYLQTFSD